MRKYIFFTKEAKYSAYKYAVHFPQTGRVWGLKSGFPYRELIILFLFALEQLFNIRKVIGNRYAI